MLQSFKMALKSIVSNKLRAVLTMLGIIIGVVALVVLVSLVSGTTDTVTDSVSSLGSDLLTVTISDDGGDPVTLDDLEEYSQADGIGLAAASSSESFTVKYDSTSDSATVIGTTPSYYDIQGLNLLLGRFLMGTDVDSNTYVCVINEAMAEDLVGYLDCVGQEISIEGMKFTIIGVLEDDDDSLTSLFTSGSYVAYIPYTTLVRLSSTATSTVSTFYVSAEDGSDTDTAESAIEAILYERYEDEDAYTVSNQSVLEDTVSSITNVLAILLGGIAGISLLVGGIGIMNIMMVTVTERTREIGIRKSIGATRGAILRQFLLEAVLLCMMGCVIGIFISWVILTLASAIVSSLSLSFTLNWAVVLLAVVFCFFIGLVFGLYPANKAAKMKPIDALHYGG